MKYYTVIDTNVLVSYLLTHNPQSSIIKLIEQIPQGVIIPLYNEDIRREYFDVLHRECFGFGEAKIQRVLDMIGEFGMNCERKAVNDVFPNPDDAVFYEVTMSRDDSYLITGNLKHFPKCGRVVTPAQMLEIIKYDNETSLYLSDVESPEYMSMTIDEINAIIREVRESIKKK